MNPAMPEVRALRALVHYQLLLLVRTPRAAFAGLLLPLGLLLLRGDGHPGADLVAGLTVLGALSTSYLTHAAGLVSARESGVLRGWRPARCRRGRSSPAGWSRPRWSP